MKPKIVDYLVARRRQKEETKRNIRLYKDNIKGENKAQHSENSASNASKAVIINGKEFIIRANSDMKDQNKYCHIINKLNSEKQKLKDTEKSKDLMNEIEETFKALDQWHSNEKKLTYVRVEEIEHKGRKKYKRKYVNKEEYNKVHQKRWTLIINMFKNK